MGEDGEACRLELVHHHLERVCRDLERRALGHLFEVGGERHGDDSGEVVLLLGLLDVARVFLLGDVGAVDNDDLAALFDLKAEVIEVLLRVEVLELVVEFQDDAILAGKLSRHRRLARARQPSNDIAELKPRRAEPRVRPLLLSRTSRMLKRIHNLKI